MRKIQSNLFIQSIWLTCVTIVTAVLMSSAVNWGNFSSMSNAIIIGYVIAGMAVVLYLFVFLKPLLKIAGTPSFAITNVLSLAAATALGTLVIQNAEANLYIEVYGSFVSSIIHTLELNDVFHSWWFVSLFFLLIVSLLDISLRREFGKKYLGFHLTHLSLIVILIGAWIDFFYGERGIMQLEVGNVKNEFIQYQGNTSTVIGQKALDFSIRLDKFESEKHAPDYKIQVWKNNAVTRMEKDSHGHEVEKKGAKAIATIPIEKGKVQNVHTTGITYKVLEYYPNHYWDYEAKIPVEEMEAKDPILIGTVTHNNQDFNIQLKSKYPEYQRVTDPNTQSYVEFVWELSPEVEQSLTDTNITLSRHNIVIKQNGVDLVNKYMQEGESYNIPNSAYQLELVKYYCHFTYDTEKKEYSNASDEDINPAVKVNFIDKKDTNSFILFSDYNGHMSEQQTKAEKISGLSFSYIYQSINKIIIAGKDNMFYRFTKKGVEKEPLQNNQPYLFAGSENLYFTVNNIFPDEYQTQKISRSKNDEEINPFVTLELNVQGKVETHHLMPYSKNRQSVVMIPNTDYYMILESFKDMETKFWKSDLSVLDKEGNVVKSQVIEVNEPLLYGGYRFYQTDYDPERPNYSGIGVSREPGLYVIYFGFYCLVIGIFMMLYWKQKE